MHPEGRYELSILVRFGGAMAVASAALGAVIGTSQKFISISASIGAVLILASYIIEPPSYPTVVENIPVAVPTD